MPWICPTITVETKEEYTRQLKKAAKLSKRVHLDVSDASLAPRRLLGLGHMRWDEDLLADVHVMSTHPHAEVAIASELKPHLVIVHAEARCDFVGVAKALNAHGIKAGIALLPETPAEKVKEYIHLFDHALIFSGNLGYQGGSMADLSLLAKIHELKLVNPRLEIGWDGGVNDQNIFELVNRGVDVINVGGFIQHAKSPKNAYAKLNLALKSPKKHAKETND